jgi:hypothetical protein
VECADRSCAGLDELGSIGESKIVIDPNSACVPCPVNNWLECSSIKPLWLGSIERKEIKGRPYYYWRRYRGKRRLSSYLSGDWDKALQKLAQLQSSDFDGSQLYSEGLESQAHGSLIKSNAAADRGLIQ